MIDVATLSVIRRWALREQLSIREIARRTGLSRNTIRKYLRAGEAEPHYAKRVSPSKLDPFALKLSGWLKTEAGRSRKQRRTVKQIYADLQALGYTGSYNRVAAFVRLWQEQRLVAQQTTGRGTFVPLAFGPGEAFQFDWSEDWAVLAGVRTKLQVAHFKLSHSRAFYLRAYLLQTHEMLFDAHNHAFVVLGGVPRRGIYDNMRTAVDPVRRGGSHRRAHAKTGVAARPKPLPRQRGKSKSITRETPATTSQDVWRGESSSLRGHNSYEFACTAQPGGPHKRQPESVDILPVLSRWLPLVR